MDPLQIPPRYRLALAGKAALLGALMALFLGLMLNAALGDHHLLMRLVLTPVFGIITVFLVWTTWMGAADALLGRARVVSGARPLPSRKSGISFRLPDGRPAEYLLVNSWAKTQLDHSYTLTIGHYSGVIISEPVDEGVTAPSAQSPTSP